MAILTKEDLIESRKGLPPLSYKTRRPNAAENMPQTTTNTRLDIEEIRDMRAIEKDDLNYYEF